MNAPAENTAPCALVLGTLFLEKPSSSTAKLLLEGLASADLPAEWPYGDKAALCIAAIIFWFVALFNAL